MSMNLEVRQQQICVQLSLRINHMIQDVNFARSVCVKLLFNCSTATRSRRSGADVSPSHATALSRPVYESSFRTSEEEYEASHNRPPDHRKLLGDRRVR